MKKIAFSLLSLFIPALTIAQTGKEEPSERYKVGLEILKQVDGEAGEAVIKALKDISPDLGRYIIEYSFGDVYSREGLDMKSKEIAAVASLIALGHMPQLKVHLNGALNTGSSINEIKEVILQMSVYAGFPAAINAMNTFKEVLDDRKGKGIKDEIGKVADNLIIENRLKNGKYQLSEIDPNQADILEDSYKDLSPELVQYILEYGYSDIYARNSLNKKYRQIATIAALTSLGNAPSQLKFHINAGINIGLTIYQINEVILLMTIYAGFPAAINGTNILKVVMEERIQ